MLGVWRKKAGQAAELPGDAGQSQDGAMFRALAEQLPINILLCEAGSGAIHFTSAAGRADLLNGLFPITAAALPTATIWQLGLIDRDAATALRFLGAPPVRGEVRLGEATVKYTLSALESGNAVTAWCLTWANVSKRVMAQAKIDRLLTMIDHMPVNIMTCSLDNFAIDYLNDTCLELMRGIEAHLPVKADTLKGQSIDIFHSQPGRIRALLADPKNLPFNTTLTIGGESMALTVSAITGSDGVYQGPMVTWQRRTDFVRAVSDFENNVQSVADAVKTAAHSLEKTAEVLAGAAETSQEQAGVVASASDQTSSNVQMVAASAEEMSGSIGEISRRVTESAQMAQQAVAQADATNSTVAGLAEASARISTVVDLINDIAGQTNLLALNATIEAARAGEAGKGFAVVASEVKNLATQTARATGDIGEQIAAIQAQTREAVAAIQSIGATIRGVSENTAAIAAAVEEQGAATAEISRNVQEAAIGTQEVASHIQTVTESAGRTRHTAHDMLNATRELTGQSESLDQAVHSFLLQVKRL